ncbi:hypothetical protein M404DRAFT_379611 [Pisolithus tinctorius Marx 270]|uniref:Uncharacterized protein n=1 Tax=Pisolithus tinctorius Marx 270 TaxID=870435 RepID=A0A0C3JA35_PISTI|nr:hypothetical protein M404DRAFT_379611 [Pisolithus tinctorius Marx 270]
MTLTTLTAPASGRKPRRHDMIHVDLKSRTDRITNIRHLINLSALLPLPANLVPSGVNDFQELCRPNSITFLNPSQVIKSYQCGDAGQRIKHLRRIYKILKDRSIPNTDKLVRAKNSVALEPILELFPTLVRTCSIQGCPEGSRINTSKRIAN